MLFTSPNPDTHSNPPKCRSVDGLSAKCYNIWIQVKLQVRSALFIAKNCETIIIVVTDKETKQDSNVRNVTFVWIQDFQNSHWPKAKVGDVGIYINQSVASVGSALQLTPFKHCKYALLSSLLLNSDVKKSTHFSASHRLC